ncbi:Uncharacterised protein [Mycobacterium tuberculosis]|nr:Uncharacterised protein [Mycobacterium tuberculosis]
MVEQRGSDEVAAPQADIIESQVITGAFATIDDGFGACLDALGDVVLYPF